MKLPKNLLLLLRTTSTFAAPLILPSLQGGGPLHGVADRIPAPA